MNEVIRQYMKVGLVHFMAYPATINGDGPILETLREIALDDYFEVVEITPLRDREIRKQVKKIVDTAHLELSYAGMPGQKKTHRNINDLNENLRLQALADLKKEIDEAYEMGAQTYAFMSGRYREDRKEEALLALIQSTKELCAYARAKGKMQIALEVFDYDIENYSLIGPVDLAKRYAQAVREEYDQFGLLVDLSHLPQLRETPAESLIPVKDYIIQAHMGNAVIQDKSSPAYGDTHPRFGFPGSEHDVEELTAYLRVLLSIGFLNKENRPIVSLEVKPAAGEDSGLVIANAKRVLNLAWDRV